MSSLSFVDGSLGFGIAFVAVPVQGQSGGFPENVAVFPLKPSMRPWNRQYHPPFHCKALRISALRMPLWRCWSEVL